MIGKRHQEPYKRGFEEVLHFKQGRQAEVYPE